LNRYAKSIFALAILGCATAVYAKDEGLYIGGSVGAASVQASISDPSLGDFDLDKSDFAYKLFAGYQFNPIFAIEGGYNDFGSVKGRDLSVATDGWTAFGVAGIPLGPIRLFGKLGGIYWESDIKGNGGSFNDDGTDWAAGAGLEFELGSFGLRAEVEYFDALDDLYQITVGATITF